MPRKRRTAEEARTAILDAAEQRLVESGPAGIRLADVAADVGVSHPTLLHHFGSRQALVDATLARVQEAIYGDVLDALGTADLEEDAMARVMERVFSALVTGGRARVLFWLALQGEKTPDEREPFRMIVEASHELRKRRRGGQNMPAAPSLEDTRFAVVLATLAMTAESVLGKHLFENIGLGGDANSEPRFRAWLARLLLKHLESN